MKIDEIRENLEATWMNNPLNADEADRQHKALLTALEALEKYTGNSLDQTNFWLAEVHSDAVKPARKAINDIHKLLCGGSNED